MGARVIRILLSYRRTAPEPDGSSKQTVSELPVLLAFKKPTTATTLVVGDKVLKRRTEAETGMKTMKVCTN